MGSTASIVWPSVLVMASVVLFVWVMAGVGRTKNRSTAAARLAEDAQGDAHRMELADPVSRRFVRPVIRAMADRARRFTPAGWMEALDRRLALAGSPRAWPLERVLAAKLILGAIGLILSIVWVAGFTLTAGSFSVAIGRFVLAPIIIFVLYMFPDLILFTRAQERQQRIQMALPDALDQMTISVEAGLGFDASLQRFVDTGTGPLVTELRRALNEVSIGVPRRQAFQNLLDRTDVQELRHFVFSINQAEQYGLPVARVLRVQARELRVLRRQRAEERALKIPVKIVLPLVLCIFPSLFVVILVPAMIRIFETLL